LSVAKAFTARATKQVQPAPWRAPSGTRIVQAKR